MTDRTNAPQQPPDSPAERFKRTPRYLLHPANRTRRLREPEPDFRDEFAERQRDRLRHAVVADCIEQLGELHDMLRTGPHGE